MGKGCDIRMQRWNKATKDYFPSLLFPAASVLLSPVASPSPHFAFSPRRGTGMWLKRVTLRTWLPMVSMAPKRLLRIFITPIFKFPREMIRSDNQSIYPCPFQIKYSFLVFFQNYGEWGSEGVLKVLLYKYISGAQHWMTGASLLRAVILGGAGTPTSVNLDSLE